VNPSQKDELLREFKELLPSASHGSFDVSRSTFLKLMGVTFAATAVGCSPMPVKKAIPYLNKPEAVTPGVDLFFASTCKGCNASCGILVKQRDGRPIKIEGNPLHPLSLGGVCASGQASVLGLYDADRQQFPVIAKQKSTWKQTDEQIVAALNETQARGKAIRLVSGSIVSPFTQSAIDAFLAHYPNAKQVIYDRQPLHALLQAQVKQFGKAILPSYDFAKAQTIVAFDADFLGTWMISSVMINACTKSLLSLASK
jgi:molybdopterin-containing oxidoreductase family iron-sulfur binding subunit